MLEPSHRRLSTAAWSALGVAVFLMVAAMAIPAALDWNVHVFSFPPLHADWDPRIGPGTLPAVAVAVLGSWYAARAAERWAWSRVLVGAFAGSVAWLTSLATVDGWDGIGVILNNQYEYLNTARDITSWSAVSTNLHEFVSRITQDQPHYFPTHIAGHPAGALLFFVLLVALGLGSGLAAGWVVLVVSATVPVAVLLTVRRLGGESAARRAAPFLVLGPAAIWMAVSADAVFTAFAAWGLCCLAWSATQPTWRRTAAWGVLAGILLGYCVMLSYGLPLLAIPAVTILVLAGNWRPLPWALVAALAVVLAFAVAGFAWWEAYPALRERYWGAIASRRPTRYWIWANLAALAFGAGPLVASSVAVAVRTATGRAGRVAADRAVAWLTLAGAGMVAVADVSGMSKAETERIWLPFVPWLLLGCALLPERWRRLGLVGQVVFALVVQHLLFTGW